MTNLKCIISLCLLAFLTGAQTAIAGAADQNILIDNSPVKTNLPAIMRSSPIKIQINPAGTRDSLSVSAISKQVKWLDAKVGAIPKEAFVASYGKNNAVYICQAMDHGEVYPGQTTEKGCVVTFGGKAFFYKKFKVLAVDAKIEWANLSRSISTADFYKTIFPPNGFTMEDSNAYNALLPANSYLMKDLKLRKSTLPVIGGFSAKYPFIPHPLYICRTMYEDAIHFGKVVQNNCNIADGDKEVFFPDFQIMFMKQGNL